MKNVFVVIETTEFSSGRSTTASVFTTKEKAIHHAEFSAKMDEREGGEVWSLGTSHIFAENVVSPGVNNGLPYNVEYHIWGPVELL